MQEIDLLKIGEDEEQEIIIDDYLISPDIEIPKPTPILQIEQYGKLIDIFTEGNMSMIQGKAKSRKSTLIKSICMAMLSGKKDFLYSNYDRNQIFIIDTEQSIYDSYKVARMLKIYTGISMPYYNVAGMHYKKKMRFVEGVLEQKRNAGFFIIDNIVHFLSDFNSATESSEVTDWLLEIKKKYNTHPCVVLHENGSDWGGGKAKGHIGTLLENLCETIIRVEKNKTNKNQSFVSPKAMRGREFDTFTLEMDMQGVPYLSEYNEEYELPKMRKL